MFLRNPLVHLFKPDHIPPLRCLSQTLRLGARTEFFRPGIRSKTRQSKYEKPSTYGSTSIVCDLIWTAVTLYDSHCHDDGILEHWIEMTSEVVSILMG